jgi:malate dehydrogenase (oxaloacetate-decarboxylating)(NADP+)
VLIMPAIHSAAISTQLIRSLGGAEVIGPILLGLHKPVQICPLGSNVSRSCRWPPSAPTTARWWSRPE